MKGNNTFLLTLTVILGLILSQLKGVSSLKRLLHKAMDTVHKFKINCGMTLAALMRDVIMLYREKPN
jgi:hypothetical protein